MCPTLSALWLHPQTQMHFMYVIKNLYEVSGRDLIVDV